MKVTQVIETEVKVGMGTRLSIDGVDWMIMQPIAKKLVVISPVSGRRFSDTSLVEITDGSDPCDISYGNFIALFPIMFDFKRLKVLDDRTGKWFSALNLARVN